MYLPQLIRCATLRRHIAVSVALYFITSVFSLAFADAVYKWKDKDGNVTYSSEPPPAHIPREKIEGPPAPTEREIKDSRNRTQKEIDFLREMREKRMKQIATEAEAERVRAEKRKHEKEDEQEDEELHPNGIHNLPPNNRPAHEPQIRPDYPQNNLPGMPRSVPASPMERR